MNDELDLYMGEDPIAVNQLRAMERVLNSSIKSRSQLIDRVLDPRRDIDDECGFPKTLEVSNYLDLYDRNPIAARVVEVLPKESWKTTPIVVEDEDPEIETTFEKAFKELSKRLRGETSRLESEEANPIWEILGRVDELSGIGSFGVLFLGIDDGKPLEEPVEFLSREPEGVEEDLEESRKALGGSRKPPNGKEVSTNLFVPKSRKEELESLKDEEPEELEEEPPEPEDYEPVRNLLFIRALHEDLVQVNTYDEDETSPRFGFPETYTIYLHDPRKGESQTSSGGSRRQGATVHWTRIIHIADNLGSSEIFGTPRLQQVFNNLYSLNKLYGGSGEMYWRGAFPGLSLESHPQLGGDVELDESALKTMMENYGNGLQRYLALMGLTAKSLAPQVVDPTPQINAQLDAICIKIGVPKRIFLGSERGELSSSQDADAWDSRLRKRQNEYLTPKVIAPLLDRLIAIGVLPEVESYKVEWPDVDNTSDADKAIVAKTLTDSIVSYVGGNGESLLPAMFYLTEILGLSTDKAESALEDAEKRAIEKEEEDLEKQAEFEEKMASQGGIPNGGTTPPNRLPPFGGKAGPLQASGKVSGFKKDEG